ncbi:MAG: flagellar basal body rod protein FlgB [Pseudomonadota bacterium]
MLEKLQQAFAFEEKALHFRAKRQEVISANIANENTPGYKARDIDFASRLSEEMGKIQTTSTAGMTSEMATSGISVTQPGHIDSTQMEGGESGLMYRVPYQTSIDGNTVELESEKSRATENAMHYMSVSNTLQQKFLWWTRFLQDTR